jgi:hypothetical protein
MASSKSTKNGTAPTGDVEQPPPLPGDELRLDAERELPALIKRASEQIASVERALSLDQSAWEEINSLFDVDGPVAKCLRRLPRAPNHNVLSVGDVLTLLKSNYLHHLALISGADEVRMLCDEFDAVRRETSAFAASLQRYKLVGSLLPPILSALDEFIGDIEFRRRILGGKRGPKTPRKFVRETILVVEIYIGARVGMGTKRGTPADGFRQLIEIIDPSIGKSTIEEVLKARSKEHSEIKR